MISWFFVQVIGSSLLLVHDNNSANIWLIDFGKTVPTPPGLTVTHSSPWSVDSHEDGYIVGLDNIIDIFQDIADNN